MDVVCVWGGGGGDMEVVGMTGEGVTDRGEWREVSMIRCGDP